MSSFSNKATYPIMKGPTHLTSSKPNHFPMASLPNMITLWVRVSTYEFEGRHKHSAHSTCLGIKYRRKEKKDEKISIKTNL